MGSSHWSGGGRGRGGRGRSWVVGTARRVLRAGVVVVCRPHLSEGEQRALVLLAQFGRPPAEGVVVGRGEQPRVGARGELQHVRGVREGGHALAVRGDAGEQPDGLQLGELDEAEGRARGPQ
eukprot:6646618-Prymnesium_polylepis.1